MNHIKDYPFDTINAVLYKKLNKFHWMFRSTGFHFVRGAINDFLDTINHIDDDKITDPGEAIDIYGISFYKEGVWWHWSFISNGFDDYHDCLKDMEAFFDKKKRR